MFSTKNGSDSDEEKELMDEIQLNQPLNISSPGLINNNDSSAGLEFINQMEQVFKAIDTEENGIISLSQLRHEIESLTGEPLDNNPTIGKLLNFLRIVHRSEVQKNQDDEDDDYVNLDDDEDNGNTLDDKSFDELSFENLELDDKKMEEEDNTYIDFQSFIESMASYMDGGDPKLLRQQRIETFKLPKFKVPLELLKKYNITPKYLSPMISSASGSPLSEGVNSVGLLSPNSTSQFSHTQGFKNNSVTNSPSKNKFGRLFTSKPIITFDQFTHLVTKLNYGKEIPKQKLLMYIRDLPTDKDDCIDANLFLSRFGGLNHPMSPKLTYDGEQQDDQYNIHSQGSSPPNSTSHITGNKGRLNSSGTNYGTNQWNKSSQIVDQLQDSYKVLEKECESFQSEISMLEKSRQVLEQNLRKKDQEIDRLRKDARFAEGMRDANKDLMVQNNNLKTQISKLTLNEDLLRESIDLEKDKARELNESVVLKDLEVKKLKLLLKTQQNINNKLAMMVSFDDGKSGSGSGSTSPNIIVDEKDRNFTSRRIKPTIDRAKQVLSRQKSEKFEIDKYSTLHANNNFALFLKQQQLLQQQQQQQSPPITSGTNSPQSLQYEFEQLQQQQFQYPQQNDNNSNTINEEPESELDSLKQQLSGLDGGFNLPSEYEINTDENNSLDDLANTPLKDGNTSPTVTPNKNNSIRVSSPSIKSTPSSAPMFSTPPANSLSPFSLTSPNGGSGFKSSGNKYGTISGGISPFVQQQQQTQQQYQPLHQASSNNQSIKSPQQFQQNLQQYNQINFSSPTLTSSLNSSNNNMQQVQDQFNVGSIRRLKKSDLIRLHTEEMEEQNESAQLIISEAEKALEEFKKNSSIEMQRIQKMYQEEKQSRFAIEKQLQNQLDKNKEMVTGKEQSSTWGGMQNFFSFVSNYLPSTLFCNLSNTS
ncbi:hypothetical protein DICPUDRAFT_95640 [Dictyostelium purpureum]|uniref:EF-hand domain-containing protein n=1 Tax=Dictyostelium purpureum TaxID=5786 RepID=F0ZYR7_DICPU|nr:uncharacterized protein DICPUDRAFT_95640 [Dictyostelium purpureum]EGC30914.1 hypothetical protein DICPUDRAFT_95640 [Dictyostelium purpureum]|eukprot:XP_003292564.1 hypothetical protein DICPUDRAFT_95640 [Dictyostelium purpureum]